MASARAVRRRTADDTAFDRARKALFEEGISTSRMYLDPRPARRRGPHRRDRRRRPQLPAPTPGARDLDELHERAVVGVQSAAGYAEGKPLHTSW